MRKFVGGMAAVVLGAGMALAGAGVANAGLQTESANVIVAWEITSGNTNSPFAKPQKFHALVGTDATELPRDYASEFSYGGIALKCGSDYQFDLYVDSTGAKELVDEGELIAPDVREEWVTGGWRGSSAPGKYGQDSFVFSTPDCPKKPEPIDDAYTSSESAIECGVSEVTISGTKTETSFQLVNNVWEKKTVRTETPKTTRALTEDELWSINSENPNSGCYVNPIVETPADEETATAIPAETIDSPDELAYTGSSETAGLIAAGLLFAAGLGMVLVRKFSTRKAV